MDPTSLPELPKPSRTPGKNTRTVIQNPKLYRTNQKHNLIILIHPFLGPYQGGFVYHLPYHMYWKKKSSFVSCLHHMLDCQTLPAGCVYSLVRNTKKTKRKKNLFCFPDCVLILVVFCCLCCWLVFIFVVILYGIKFVLQINSCYVFTICLIARPFQLLVYTVWCGEPEVQ